MVKHKMIYSVDEGDNSIVRITINPSTDGDFQMHILMGN